jgi:hypothetical protein
MQETDLVVVSTKELFKIGAQKNMDTLRFERRFLARTQQPATGD